jgi:hypothetical protein
MTNENAHGMTLDCMFNELVSESSSSSSTSAAFTRRTRSIRFNLCGDGFSSPANVRLHREGESFTSRVSSFRLFRRAPKVGAYPRTGQFVGVTYPAP